MNVPKVTVITPVYRKRETIMDTIKSVCTQTYPDIQFIIVDDGPYSVDESIGDYIESFNTISDYLIIHNERNMGTSFSLNRGVEESKGDIIFNIADDDCFYDSDVIMDWVMEFTKTDAEVITCKRAIYDKTLLHFDRIDPSDEVFEKIKTMTNQELFDEMSGYNLIFGSVTAKKRSLFEKPYGKYSTDYHIIEDYSSNMVLLRNGVKFYFYDRVAIKYREGGVSSAGNIDSVYLKESNRLFKREILPFVSSKIKSIYKYERWKMGVKISSWRKSRDKE